MEHLQISTGNHGIFRPGFTRFHPVLASAAKAVTHSGGAGPGNRALEALPSVVVNCGKTKIAMENHHV
jgi:hypothetical protein